MNPSESEDSSLIDEKMYDLFRIDLENQSRALSQGLIALEKEPGNSTVLEKLMRAAHSIKGAARVIALNPIVQLSHAMEDCFVAAQKGGIEVRAEQVDLLFKCLDLLDRMAKLKANEVNAWMAQSSSLIDPLIQELSASFKEKEGAENREPSALNVSQPIKNIQVEKIKKKEPSKVFQTSYPEERVLRITAENLNRLMGLAGESLVESRWLYPFGESLQKFKLNFKRMESTARFIARSFERQESE